MYKNKIRSRLLLIGTLLCGLLQLPSRSFAASAMQACVSAMQPGWNLGNTLDAVPTETSWGNPLVTQALIQQIAAQGYKSIRVPVTWTDHMGAAPNYTIDSAWMDRVQQIVDWSLDAGLYVMINVHHDSWQWVGAMPANHDAVLAKYTAVWTQIANRFKNHSNRLMFESVNEPSFDSGTEAAQMALLDELNAAFYNVVRGTGGGNTTRPLVLPGLGTSPAQVRLDSLSKTIARLNDSNLIATIHYYGYWPFSVNIAGATKFDAAASDDINTQLNGAYNTFVGRGIPVIMGEFGLLAFDSDASAVERGEMLKYFEYLTQYARAKDITHMLWDNGQHFNRTAYQWRDPKMYGTIVQSLTGRSSTTDTDLIFLKSDASVADAVLNLNLNGNSFVSLEDGSTPLASGRDYTLNGSTLTVKAGALAGHAAGSLGETATLQANFSAGPAWKIHVRYFSTPALSDATGTTSAGLVIPAAFNGDLVATMEANYASGGNAGPANWTSYKEYGYAFSPSYMNGSLTITPKFFAETNAGTVNLKFHFWSGQDVKYKLTTSGTSVTGTAESAPASNPTTTTNPPTSSTTTSTPSTSGFGASGGGGGGGAPSMWFFAATAAAWLARRRWPKG